MRTYIRRPIRERLLERLVIDLDSPPGIDGAPCWNWRGSMRNRSYGSIGRGGRGGGSLFTHRVAYELWFGPIPKGLDVDHLCRNPACCNPAHLEAVTRKVNLARGEHWPPRRVPWSAEVRQP